MALNLEHKLGYMPELPQHILEDIFNRLEDARHIALAQTLCRDWWEAGFSVRSLLVTVLDAYHERARAASNSPVVTTFKLTTSSGSAGDIIVKEQVVKILNSKPGLEKLRIEVEPTLQAKTVPEGERRRTDFWLTDPYFLRQWVPTAGLTLQHLSLVDYGQQAIMCRSSILKILSMSCKHLKTLDLRNMYIDTSDCEEMGALTTLTFRCVKVDGEALQHMNEKMPNLQTAALLGLVGAGSGGDLTFSDMKVLCLGLSTPAENVGINLPKLEKLQLRMQCPSTTLKIQASSLKYVAFNLDASVARECQPAQDGAIKIICGPSSFITLSSSAEKIPNIGKIFQCTHGDRRSVEVADDLPNIFCANYFLDIPCMKLLKDGRYLDLLNDTPTNLPSFTQVHECGHPHVSYTPPGLIRHWRGDISDGLNLEINTAV